MDDSGRVSKTFLIGGDLRFYLFGGLHKMAQNFRNLTYVLDAWKCMTPPLPSAGVVHFLELLDSLGSIGSR